MLWGVTHTLVTGALWEQEPEVMSKLSPLKTPPVLQILCVTATVEGLGQAQQSDSDGIYLALCMSQGIFWSQISPQTFPDLSTPP